MRLICENKNLDVIVNVGEVFGKELAPSEHASRAIWLEVRLFAAKDIVFNFLLMGRTYV